MLKYTDIQQGVFFSMDGAVYETIDAVFSKKSRQKGSNQVRIKHLTTGAVTTKTLHPSDTFEAVSIEKKEYIFVFSNQGTATIHPVGSPSDRLTIPIHAISGISLLPSGTPVTALVHADTICTIIPPIKVDLLVTEAAPGVRGNTAQGGTKRVMTETGTSITTPLFINTGDRIRVNTETGEYVERIS